MAEPCTKDALLLHKNSTQSATSCAVPFRFIGAMGTEMAIGSPWLGSFGLIIGVSENQIQQMSNT